MVKQRARIGEIGLSGHPRSVIGTPAWRGPYSRLRCNEAARIEQAAAAWELVEVEGLSVRAAADALGLSVTTTWRRARWYADWTLGPMVYGLPWGPKPHQRGTRAVPRGRPVILPLDAPEVFRDLLASGASAETIAASWRTVPVCIRDIAISHMIREGLDEDGRAWFDEEAQKHRERPLTKRLTRHAGGGGQEAWE
jgi:hypothetical protein